MKEKTKRTIDGDDLQPRKTLWYYSFDDGHRLISAIHRASEKRIALMAQTHHAKAKTADPGQDLQEVLGRVTNTNDG
jgi:hypothetical protein